QEAVTETEATRSELDKVRQQKNSLELQVKSLKDTNGKIIAEAELAQAELQRMKDSREKERESVEGRVRDQEQKIKDLIAQHKTLRQEYDEAKLRNETLTAAVARYQKELKDRQNAGQSAPALPKAPTSSVPTPPAPQSAAPKLPAPPAKVPVPAPSAPATQSAALAPVNVNTATANDMVLFL